MDRLTLCPVLRQQLSSFLFDNLRHVGNESPQGAPRGRRQFTLQKPAKSFSQYINCVWPRVWPQRQEALAPCQTGPGA